MNTFTKISLFAFLLFAVGFFLIFKAGGEQSTNKTKADKLAITGVSILGASVLIFIIGSFTAIKS